ncbi:hypothetical protein BD309DRAFT_966596 [Dichomitus squalens]|uniref:Uncharacterized protein n=1 Tax=Dichomitus squalens TaxID=114155 RepID=A0A4Q9MZT4_9APHY|nr:uncharacterized protein DICSQDRAFT_152680 [Dichomitus squalens LYAD-421 SS1]EJF65486.1 hypothetical protein DICSQDRAFT_152680 [Dichomitus squalens LYAD-421 SS1]TBU33674.1 hypothetical protein BD311DRAFT_747750 [Dichomitus squalens]TBU40782.1 hypothetical protein BD309DRAFT_966596 [Dichomitus squalens]
MNPPHILIARNSRGPNTHNPSASLSSPTETHAAAAGIFRSAGSPSWYFEEYESDGMTSSLSTNGDMDDPIEIDETFTLTSKFPGNVKIVVESTTFWAHKEILYFASAFFQAALSGGWAETEKESGRPQSVSSVITISQPPVVPGSKPDLETHSEITFAPMDPDMDPDELDLDIDISDSDASDAEASTEDKTRAREDSLSKLEKSNPTTPTSPSEKAKAKAPDIDGNTAGPSTLRRTRLFKRQVPEKEKRPDAIIVLKEEKASTFHDFLKYVYPHLVCTITWNNVEGLMNISHKLHVSALQNECLTFLLTHAAGRPIKAMRIAELFDEEELYRESSRFVLDNPGGWSEEELGTLSQATLLKLEKRRTWFLERVLKLGLVQIAKEYQCCLSCPDSANCARLLDEKWKQAYQAVFRFGPCQPSMVFRYLRTLEGVSPPLSLTHLSCQTTAKAFVATLFDRMFSLGVRGSGTDTAPLGARVAAVAGSATSGPRRHFLYCSLHGDTNQRSKRSREQS